MPIRLRVQLDAAKLQNRLRNLRANDLPDWRRRATDSIGRHVLTRTITHNPVDTARARSAWVTALERLGGTPPPQWRGPAPRADAIAEGHQLSHVSITENETATDLRAASRVEYINYLEFGTRRMRPFAMVRRALAETRQILRQLLPPLPR